MQLDSELPRERRRPPLNVEAPYCSGCIEAAQMALPGHRLTVA